MIQGVRETVIYYGTERHRVRYFFVITSWRVVLLGLRPVLPNPLNLFESTKSVIIDNLTVYNIVLLSRKIFRVKLSLVH